MTEFVPAQCRAARGLLGWTQAELAARSKTAPKTVADFELGNTTPQKRTIERVQACLEKAGVIFIDPNGEGPGVRLKKRK